MSFLAATASGSTLSNVEPGALGFLVVAGIGLVLVFLLKNMNKQFKKLGPPPKDTDADSAGGEAGESEEARDTTRTGDAKQDERAEGSTKRK